VRSLIAVAVALGVGACAPPRPAPAPNPVATATGSDDGAAISTAALPRTRAESSHYLATSTYADVIAFLHGLQAAHVPIALGSIGRSTHGRDIPYVIASRPLVTSPAEARALGRPIVYVNADIHAGEVEGKEAILALVRDLAASPAPNVLDSVVLIAVPIYNPDGNEAFAPQSVNRTEQNGPELVGQRANGQGLDLNRDYVKAEAPETRGSLAMFRAWDPDVYVDLHTTDGSYHGYALTYSPSLNPDAYLPQFPGALTRDTMLPEIRAAMQRDGFATFDYGNFDAVYEERDVTDTTKRGWYTYDHTPRYGTNYYGMVGRVSILSEAYSHDPFQRRIAATYAFVHEIMESAARHSTAILAERAQADSVAAGRVAIGARLTTHPYTGQVTFEVLRHTGDSSVTQPGVPRGLARTGRFITQWMPVYDRFEPTRMVEAPQWYLLPPGFPAVERVLREHGIPLEPAPPQAFDAQEFVVDSIHKAAHPFQGHLETHLVGHWRETTVTPPPGSLLVPASGRMGPIAVYLLEPESDDGLVDWNFFDASLAPGRPYPLRRLYP